MIFLKKILKFVTSFFKNTFNKILFILIIIYFYFLFQGYITLYNLIISICITILIVIYKLLLDCCTLDKFIFDLRKKGDKINIRYYFFLLDKYLIKKNVWLIKPIYYILYYFPTNWPYLIVLWIARKWWDVRLYVNSNKDVIGKKYFKKDLSKLKIKSVFINKYIFTIIYSGLFLSLYIKFNLLIRNWDKFFLSRVFGITYSTVLIVNNLHLFIWFKNTDIFDLKYKVFLIILFSYFLLYFFPFFIKLIIGNLDSNYFSNKLKLIKKDDLDSIFEFYQLLWVKLNKFLEEKTISNYYFVKDYLIFMCLAERYCDWIDNYYSNFLSKNLNNNNINLPSNMIKIGRIEYSYISDFTILKFYKNVFSGFTFLKFDNDFIWILEKNYRVSFFLYSFYMNNRYDNFFYECLNYELFKLFYGNNLIDDYFKKEMEELESFYFIYLVWNELLINDLKVILNLQNIILNEENICLKKIPNFFNNNKLYNQYLDLFNLFIFLNKKILWLDYNIFLSKEISFHIDIIYSDINRYKEEYGNDINKFIYFWTKTENKELLDDPFMKLRIEIFSKHIPHVNLKIDNLKNEAKKYYYNFIKLNNNIFLNNLKKLELKHKDLYFSKQPEKSLSSKFFDENQIKNEWEIFFKK